MGGRPLQVATGSCCSREAIRGPLNGLYLAATRCGEPPQPAPHSHGLAHLVTAPQRPQNLALLSVEGIEGLLRSTLDRDEGQAVEALCQLHIACATADPPMSSGAAGPQHAGWAGCGGSLPTPHAQRGAGRARTTQPPPRNQYKTSCPTPSQHPGAMPNSSRELSHSARNVAS
jgi:hypothetical protein